jgi:hypothetical protein
MPTVLSSPARPLDPRQEGVSRRLVAYEPDAHEALVRRVGCVHPALSEDEGILYFEFCDACRAQREAELAEAGR